MSASLRFLAVAVIAWAGIRAATLDRLPGIELTGRALAEPVAGPPIIPTEFPPIAPVVPYDPAANYAYGGAVAPDPMLPPGHAYAGGYYPMPYRSMGQYSEPRPYRPASHAYAEPIADPVFYAEIPTLDDWSLTSSGLPALSGRRSTPAPAAAPGMPQAIPAKLDRLQLSAWALLRGQPGPGGLASGGTLGGSQAGARLTYAIDPRIAASLRTSSPIGAATRGGEVAAGVRLTPFPSIPVALTAERRQAIGRDGGRSAFALFLEGGVYGRSLPWNFSLDGYAQAGVVGVRSRDLFADGGMTISRHLYGPVSVGIGGWGGVQPGLYRVDAGPRLSMRVRKTMRIDLDWRQRLAGSAEPGSGPAVTLSGNF